MVMIAIATATETTTATMVIFHHYLGGKLSQGKMADVMYVFPGGWRWGQFLT